MCTRKPVTKRPKKQSRKPQTRYCYPCIVIVVMPMPWTWVSTDTGNRPKKAGAKVISMKIKIKQS